jgi:hypothetical protein
MIIPTNFVCNVTNQQLKTGHWYEILRLCAANLAYTTSAEDVCSLSKIK